MPVSAIEEAVFGTVLWSGDVKALKLLQPEYFTDSVLRTAVEFCKSNNTLDSYILDNTLLNNESYSGYQYLKGLPNFNLTSDKFSEYLRTLKSESLSKKLQHDIANAVLGKPVDQQISSTKAIVSGIEEELRNANTKSYKVSEYRSDVLDSILELSELGGAYSGIPTGIKGLDTMLSGFQNTDLIIVGARPGVGKSSLITTIAQNIHVLKPEAVIVIFSLEMSRKQLIQRLLSGFGRIPLQKLVSGNLSLQEWARLIYANSILAKCNIYIDDKSAITIDHVYEVLSDIKSQTGRLDLVFIDYLQLMRSNNRHMDKRSEITELSGNCKMAAKEFNIPFVVLSQLSRSPQNRTNKRPQDSDLRESGSIEQDADIIIFLYRPHKDDPTPDNEFLAEIIVSKHRNGATGTINAAYIKHMTRFENIIQR